MEYADLDDYTLAAAARADGMARHELLRRYRYLLAEQVRRSRTRLDADDVIRRVMFVVMTRPPERNPSNPSILPLLEIIAGEVMGDLVTPSARPDLDLCHVRRAAKARA